MENYNELIHTISLTMGAAWASGINLYATILVLGVLGITDAITLPAGLEILANPVIIAAAGIMYLIEFFADKIPAVDSAWDSIHTFIRIPLGALLAAGAVGTVNPAVTIAAALLGGGLAAGSHAAKAGTRVMINASPEPFTNVAASVGEDVAVVAGLWARPELSSDLSWIPGCFYHLVNLAAAENLAWDKTGLSLLSAKCLAAISLTLPVVPYKFLKCYRRAAKRRERLLLFFFTPLRLCGGFVCKWTVVSDVEPVVLPRLFLRQFRECQTENLLGYAAFN